MTAQLKSLPGGKGKKPGGKSPSVVAALASGSQVDLLRAVQRRTAEKLDDPKISPRDFAALSKRFVDLGEQIRQLEAESDDDGAAPVGKVTSDATRDGGADDTWDPSAI